MGTPISDALGGYVWIDNVLLDGMDYFAGMFGFFLSVCTIIARAVLFIGLVINAIKLMFGAEAIKKVLIGTISKIVIFLFLMTFYNRIVASVANTALQWGSISGGGRGSVASGMENLMFEAKHELAIAQQLAKYPLKERKKKLKAMSKDYRERKGKGIGKGSNNLLVDGMVSKEGVLNFQNQANLYRDTDEVLADQVQTMEILSSILVPGKSKDKNGNEIDRYFLSCSLKNLNGDDTQYISPASFLKIAILTGKLIWKRQADYCTVKYGEAKEDAEGFGKMMPPEIKAFFETYTISVLFNFLLCFICQLAIIICAILALIQYIMTVFEYSIVTSVIVFYIPFYLSDATKSITAKLFPIFWNFFIKLMIITICMWFSLFLYINLASDQISGGLPFDLTVFCTTMFTILLSFIVTQSSPKISQTIISGNPELSMGEFLAGVATMGGAAMLGKKAVNAGQKGVATVAGGASRLESTGALAYHAGKASGKSGLKLAGHVAGSIGREGGKMAQDGIIRGLTGKGGVKYMAEQSATGFENQLDREMSSLNKRSQKDNSYLFESASNKEASSFNNEANTSGELRSYKGDTSDHSDVDISASKGSSYYRNSDSGKHFGTSNNSPKYSGDRKSRQDKGETTKEQSEIEDRGN